MSVLRRKELEDSPLADLHAIASELGLEGYRTLRREELIAAILEAQGGGDDEPAVSEEAIDEAVVETPGPAGEEEPEIVDEVVETPENQETRPPSPVSVDAPTAVEPPPEPELPAEAEAAAEAEPEPEPEEVVTGVLDILPNGSGFVRAELSGQSRDDVYVAPAQIRRLELRAGDEVSGPVRPARRNERHPSLVRVASVNGRDPEPPEERPHFEELTPVFPTERLAAPPALASSPLGKGSRVAVSGPPGAGATTLLRELASTLAERHPEVSLSVVLVGVRPEEVTDWRRSTGAPVAGGSFERSTEAQAQAADLAVERAKRTVERGGDAVLVVDTLEALPPGAMRRVFGAARKAEEGGSLTVIGSTGMATDPQRFASTLVVLHPRGEGKDGARVWGARSSTLREDLLR